MLDGRREDFGVGLEEGQRRLMGGGKVEGALAADGEHGWVDIGYGDVDVWVAVAVVGSAEHAEGDIACASGDVEDLLRPARGVGGPRVQGGDEMVPGERGGGLVQGRGAIVRWGTHFHRRWTPRDMRSFILS